MRSPQPVAAVTIAVAAAASPTSPMPSMARARTAGDGSSTPRGEDAPPRARRARSIQSRTPPSRARRLPDPEARTRDTAGHPACRSARWPERLAASPSDSDRAPGDRARRPSPARNVRGARASAAGAAGAGASASRSDRCCSRRRIHPILRSTAMTGGATTTTAAGVLADLHPHKAALVPRITSARARTRHVVRHRRMVAQRVWLYSAPEWTSATSPSKARWALARPRWPNGSAARLDARGVLDDTRESLPRRFLLPDEPAPRFRRSSSSRSRVIGSLQDCASATSSARRPSATTSSNAIGSTRS